MTDDIYARTGTEQKELMFFRQARVVFSLKYNTFLLETVIEYHLMKYMKNAFQMTGRLQNF